MSAVAMASVQYVYRCPFEGCEHTVTPPRTRCAVHAMRDDWDRAFADPVFQANFQITYRRHCRTGWRQERN